jgi:transposase
MKAYSPEFREAVAKAYDECGSSTEVADQFNCSASWVRRLIQGRRERATLDPKPAKLPDNSVLTEKDCDTIRKLIQTTPDMTLGEIAAALDDKVTPQAIWYRTQKMGLVLKKKRSSPANRIGRT